VLEIRGRYKESFQKKHGVNLGFMSFFVKACVRRCGVSRCQCFIDGPDIVYHHYYDVGVAVSTERLMVPSSATASI